MQDNESPSIHDTLSELRGLLTEEREALKSFNTKAVVAISTRLLELEEAIRIEYRTRSPSDPAERKALVEIKELTLRNQVLLVHARACVRGIVARLASHHLVPVDADGLPRGGGVRLNIQG